MHISEFISSAQEELHRLDYIKEVEIKSEVFTTRITSQVNEKLSIKIFYDEKTGTISYALLNQQRRIWGVDYTEMSDWHEHTFEDPESYISIQPKNTHEVIQKLNTILQIILYEN